MDRNIVIFVCEHGAAKSVIAATYFNQLADQQGLTWEAIARGTNPDHELSLPTIDGLANDGLAPVESAPQKLSSQDIRLARRIVSFCELPEKTEGQVGVERWENMPAVSDGYDRARDAIVERLHHLLDDIRSTR